MGETVEVNEHFVGFQKGYASRPRRRRASHRSISNPERKAAPNPGSGAKSAGPPGSMIWPSTPVESPSSPSVSESSTVVAVSPPITSLPKDAPDAASLPLARPDEPRRSLPVTGPGRDST